MAENINKLHLAQFNLKIGGAEAPAALLDVLLECTVENSLQLADVCTLRFNDANFRWLDAKELFKIGNTIEVLAGYEKEALTSVFYGEINGLEMDLAAHGVPILQVRAYDKMHRLCRGRHADTFVDMTDSDIVNKVGAAAGLKVNADATTEVHSWVCQQNQTHWEFLSARAARAGHRLYVERDTLKFDKVKNEAPQTVEIEWGLTLRSFRPRIASSGQVSEVMVRGWDQKKKQTIMGSAKQPQGIPQIQDGRNGGEVVTSAFGESRMVITDRPVKTQKEAEQLAQSICDDMGGEFLEAEGLCNGDTKLKPGVMADIKNIGDRFSGKYHVTATTHTYTPAEGYSTLFSVSGKRPSTMLAALEWQGSGSRTQSGGTIVVGKVTDNKDPANLQRVKVMYPWLSEDHASEWIRMVAPMAGAGRGFRFLPEIDDEVLVAFEQGDIHRAYVIGAIWSEVDKPPPTNTGPEVTNGAKVVSRFIKTRTGQILAFGDEPGKQAIVMLTGDGKNHYFAMHDSKKYIMMESKDKALLCLNDDKGEVEIWDQTTNNKIIIKKSDNSILISCQGDMTLEATKNIHLKAGQKITLDAQGGIEATTPAQVKIEGQAGVNIHSPATVDVKADGMLNLEGQGMASLKSSGILTVQGTLVKIN